MRNMTPHLWLIAGIPPERDAYHKACYYPQNKEIEFRSQQLNDSI